MKPAQLLLTGVGLLLPLLAYTAEAGRTETTIVQDGKPVAVIVTPDAPSAVVRYAAEELATHVRKATGATLTVVRESETPAASVHRIYLGPCRAATEAGIDTGKLAAEGFALRTAGRSLFIVGNDGGGDPLDPDTRAGTLFGTYEWLEAAMRVRWLWPGELGTHVPRARTLMASEMNRTGQPVLFQRRVRPGLSMEPQNRALGFTPKAFEQYVRDQNVFLRRHRMGRSRRMSYGHAFSDWWEKHGREHPEWFQQLPDGRRGPHKKTARYSMCVSDPGFQGEIVARWKAAGGAKPGPSFINAVENDYPGMCACPRCQAWDGPTPPDALKFYSAKSKVANTAFVSDRYARFWLAVQQEAARVNSEATVIGYVYFNYFQAPTSGVKLNSNVLLGFCPSGGWYPRAADEHAWYQRQWSGWRATGARLFARTNYFLDGYSMPFIFAHQFADDFRHAAREGMVATDFDSLTGQWSTQGPNLYLLMRLHTRPEATTDDLLAEYYAGFGPAAAEVKAYFDYWERYTMGKQPQLNPVFEQLEASRWRTWARGAHAIFPPDGFAPAEALLAKATAAAAGEREALARVEFLRKGLQHARLCAKAAAVLSLSRPEAPEAERTKVLHALMTFRRSTEREGIANFNQLAWVEDLSWKLPVETRQPADLFP